ncbi:COG4223 family protein [Halocynthiibacter namhaensis]|uniref:COG4223 family protein n=1 Tax=Halocynthiibacter namhaensis TaxID=1290553 RepID=UPI0012E02592|nr:hypothetical protein [Halocynthiibacter namhaensis]
MAKSPKKPSKLENEISDVSETIEIVDETSVQSDTDDALSRDHDAVVSEEPMADNENSPDQGETPGDMTLEGQDSEETAVSDTDADDDAAVVNPEGSDPEDTEVDGIDDTLKTSEPAPKKNSPAPLILGGAVAAMIGFGVSYVVPEGWPSNTERAAEVTAQLETQASQIAGLNDRFEALDINDPDAAIAPVEAWVTEVTDTLKSDLDAVQEQLAAFDQRIETLEKRPISGETASGDAVAAYERDVQALRDQLEGQRAEIEAILSNAQTRSHEAEVSSQQARATTAVSMISRALTTGADFTATLATLDELGVTVPAALSESGAGAITLDTLQNNFTAPARLALDAGLKSGVEDGSVSRIGGFLRRRLGMRSLTPREGDDANAILSRAEFSLKEGRVADAISEIATLSADGQALMSDWIAQATTHENVAAAFSELNTAVDSMSDALATE